MRKLLLFLLLFLFNIGLFAENQNKQDKFVDSLQSSTVMLYTEGDDSSMIFNCTAVAFGDSGDITMFETAGHCVSGESANGMYFVSSGQGDNREFYRVTVELVGDQTNNEDFAILELKSKKRFSTIKLGTDPLVSGEKIINITASEGIGIQILQGYVSLPVIDRPMKLDGGGNWQNNILLQMFGTNSGSSGSPVVCVRQKAICGFIVGTSNKTSTVAIPVSRFEKFIIRKTEKQKTDEPNKDK